MLIIPQKILLIAKYCYSEQYYTDSYIINALWQELGKEISIDVSKCFLFVSLEQVCHMRSNTGVSQATHPKLIMFLSTLLFQSASDKYSAASVLGSQE